MRWIMPHIIDLLAIGRPHLLFGGIERQAEMIIM
jgi:hypothetical protein